MNTKFKKSLFYCLAAIFFLSPAIALAQLKYLQHVKDMPPHPRILLLQGEEQQIKANISADPAWAKIHRIIISECDNMPFPTFRQCSKRN